MTDRSSTAPTEAATVTTAATTTTTAPVLGVGSGRDR
jgi:hypothetical protein